MTSLTKLLSTASALPDFTPALGHTYLPPAIKAAVPGSNPQTAQESKEGTPMPGAGTPRPDAQDVAGTRPIAPKLAGESSLQDTRMLAESWDLSIRYGNDYMDENPIVGEPGNFKLAKTKNLALAMAKVPAAPQPFKAPPKKASAPPIKTDLPADKDKKATPSTGKTPITPGLKDKKGRRKSKAAGMSTPRATTPKPATPG